MSDLKDKLKDINDRIGALTTDAQAKWQAFDAERTKFAEAGQDANNTESESFKQADGAHRAYNDVKGEIIDLEQVREGLWRMLADRDPNGHKQHDQHDQPAPAGEAPPMIGLARKAMESADYKAAKDRGVFTDGSRLPIGTIALAKQADAAEAKALIVEGGPSAPSSNTGAGAFFRPDRVGYYPLVERPLMLADLVTLGETQTNAVEFVKQTGFANNAAFVAEAIATADGSGLKPESGMTFEVVQSAVKTLAHWIPATKNALADAGQLRTIIEEQLRYGLNYVLDAQLVGGDGTGQNLTGILNTAGIGTHAKGTTGDSNVDAIHRALTIVRLQYLEPNAVAMHPNDWENIRLLKDQYGSYLYGPPAISGTQQVWGLPVVAGAQFTAGTAIVGDFKQAIMWLREGISVLASDSHADFFVRNLVAVLAELRAAFGIVRPGAFCTVTGL